MKQQRILVVITLLLDRVMRNSIIGHSGCIVTLQSGANHKVNVLKSTNDINYIDRLENQAIKQDRFYNKYSSGPIKTPKIIRIEKNINSCRVYMEYIFANNFIDYFNNSSVKVLDTFINSIINFINFEIVNSNIMNIDTGIIKDKVDDVFDKIERNKIVNSNKGISKLLYLCFDVLKIDESISIPVGVCHGDLTLSNILFKGNEIYIIDFLDSFLETPLVDIVKLRQDTFHSWSYKLYNKNYDSTRNRIILKYIDDALVDEFIKLRFYKEYYTKFQIINLLRVLQYTKERSISVYLIEEIYKIIDK